MVSWLKTVPWRLDARAGAGVRLAIAGAIVLLWLPFLLLSGYATPALDDFLESAWGPAWASRAPALVNGHTMTWAGVQRARYVGYTGRVAGSAVQALNPWHWRSIVGYRLSAVLRILLFIASLSMFAGALNRAWLGATQGELLYLGAIFSFALLATHPAPAEFFYWYSASVIYCVPLSVLLCSTALLVRRRRGTGRGRARLVVACAGFFYVSGNVEMLPCLVLALAVPLAATAAWLRRPWGRDVALVAVVTASGLAVNAVSPGNAVRAAQMHTLARSVEPTALLSDIASYTLRSAGHFFRERSTLLAGLLATPVFLRLARRRLRIPSPPLVAGVGAYGLLALYALPLWGLGFSVGRVEAVAWFFFLLAFFALVASTAVVVERWLDLVGIRRSTAIVLPLLLGATVAVFVLARQRTDTIALAVRELVDGTAAEFADASAKRLRWAEDTPCGDIVAPSLGTVSRMLAPVVIETPHGLDVMAAHPDGWWSNNLYAQAHGKRTFRVGVPPLSCAEPAR